MQENGKNYKVIKDVQDKNSDPNKTRVGSDGQEIIMSVARADRNYPFGCVQHLIYWSKNPPFFSGNTDVKTEAMNLSERFVSEPIKPVVATCDTMRMAIGEPGLPHQFVWRGRIIEIKTILRTWRETGKCRHGSPDMYVRKHWYEVATLSHGIMKIYFDRQSRGGNAPRWWLFSVRTVQAKARGAK